MPSLKERCQAVVRLDRAEQAVEDTHEDAFRAFRRGEPMRGYWIAYEMALNALAGARAALDRMKGGR